MFDKLFNNIVAGLLRNGATALGGYLVAQGNLDPTQVDSLIGSVMFLGGIAWTIVDKVVIHKNKV